MSTSQPPFFIPPPSRWQTFHQAHVEQDLRDLKKDAFAMNFMSPRAPDSLDEQQKEAWRSQFPEGYAAERLKQSGIEAFRTLRPMAISGGFFSPDDVICLWPLKPVEGFALREELRTVAPHDVERFPDGSVRLLTGLVFSERRYKEDAIIEPWPEVPLPGFITARRALELLSEGAIEPVTLQEPSNSETTASTNH